MNPLKTASEPLFSALDHRKSVSSAEVAKVTGFSLRAVQVYAQRGLIPGSFRIGNRGGWRFKRAELEAWWKAQGQ